MSTVRAAVDLGGHVSEAEALWYDTARWPSFVDGFATVVAREGEWPQAGGVLVWDSRPGGRGRVVERVTAYEPRRGQRAEVEDSQLTGVQSVTFTPRGADARLELALEYRLKRDAPWFAAVDLLFIRRALRDSLRRTVVRFSREHAVDRELAAEEPP